MSEAVKLTPQDRANLTYYARQIRHYRARVAELEAGTLAHDYAVRSLREYERDLREYVCGVAA